MTKGHHLGKPDKTNQLLTHLSHKKKSNHLYHLDRHEGLGQAREPHHNNPYYSKNLERKMGIIHICLPGRAWPTLLLMCYRVGMERRWKSATLQTTQGHRSSKPKKTTQLPMHLSHGKKTCHLYHLDRHEGPRWARKPHHNNPWNSNNLERRRGMVHICLLGWAWPTLLLMCYWMGMDRRWKSTTLQITKGHHSGKPKK